MNTNLNRDETPKDRFGLLKVFRVFLIIAGPIMLIVLLRLIFTLVDRSKTLTSEMSAPFDLGQLAGLCVLIAFLTSAIVQVLKEQGKLRAEVHRATMKKWLEQRFSCPHRLPDTDTDQSKLTVEWKISDHSEQVEKEIEQLCAAGSSDQFFYNLSTEQFCGQLATGVDLVMIAPQSYPNWFAALTSGEDKNHQKAVTDFLTLESRKYSKIDYNIQETSNTSQYISDPDYYDRLRARITNYAQRALDGMQLEATRRWKLQLMLASIQISLGISLAVAAIVDFPLGFTFSSVWRFAYATMICGVAGALLAPIAYDITTAFRGLGRR